MVEEKRLDKYIMFRDGVPMDRMPEVYKLADVLLVTLRKNQITVPGKLQTCMATGKPVIGAMDGSGAELIQEANCGKCAPAEDCEKLSELMSEYIVNPRSFDGMGANGRNYFVENFSLKKYIEGLTDILMKNITDDNHLMQ